jgi:predicted N-acetyltransferase YhbS
VKLRPEQPGDESAISAVTEAAFTGHPHSDGSEVGIVERLRGAGALTISLVAEDAGQIVGHAAFSPVTIADGTTGWFGLGPVSVQPGRQREGIGSALIRAGLEQLRQAGAAGCVVLGDPAYYGRFGYTHDPVLTYPVPLPEAFQQQRFTGASPKGEVTYHAAFG